MAFTEKNAHGALSGLTQHDLIACGETGRLIIKEVSLYVKNVAAATEVFQFFFEDEADNERIIWSGELEEGDTFIWSGAIVLNVNDQSISFRAAEESTTADWVVAYAEVT